MSDPTANPLISTTDWIPFPDVQLKLSYAAISYSNPNDASFLAVQTGAELSLLGTSHDGSKVLALHPASGQQGWLPNWVAPVLDNDVDTFLEAGSGSFTTDGLNGIPPSAVDGTPNDLLLTAPAGDGVMGPGGLWSPVMETGSPPINMGAVSPAMSSGSDFTIASNDLIFGTPSPKHQTIDLNQQQLSLQALAAQQMSQPTPARFYQNPRGRRPRQHPQTPRNDLSTDVDTSGGGPIRSGRNRKLWDHKYEAGRKEAGTRGHGTNFEEEQKLRFPESNPPFVTYAGFVDQLLRVLWEQGRGQVVFTLDAVARARERVTGYKSRAGKSKVRFEFNAFVSSLQSTLNLNLIPQWRVWLPDETWAKFQILKKISAPANITHPEFAELLLDLAGVGRKGHSTGLRPDLLAPAIKSEPQDLFLPTERPVYSPTPSTGSEYSSTTTVTTDEMFTDLSALDSSLGTFLNNLTDADNITTLSGGISLQDEGLWGEIFGELPTPTTPSVSPPHHVGIIPSAVGSAPVSAGKNVPAAPAVRALPGERDLPVERGLPVEEEVGEGYPAYPSPPSYDHIPEKESTSPRGLTSPGAGAKPRRTSMAAAASRIGSRVATHPVRAVPYVKASADAEKEGGSSAGVSAVSVAGATPAVASVVPSPPVAEKKTSQPVVGRKSMLSRVATPRHVPPSSTPAIKTEDPPTKDEQPLETSILPAGLKQVIDRAVTVWQTTYDIKPIVKTLGVAKGMGLAEDVEREVLEGMFEVFRVAGGRLSVRDPVVGRTAVAVTWMRKRGVVGEEGVGECLTTLLTDFATDEEMEDVPEAFGAVLRWLVRSGVVGVDVLGVVGADEDEAEGDGETVAEVVKGVEQLSVA
ncbi:hypothetical protein HDV00_006744 [Rhizophlyctis rosea]|nr:hypothetical protein HDV00_006744 [Rhizophlyctis rosea]